MQDALFELERWPRNVALAWTLTRNEDFTSACTRSDAPYVVEVEASDWRHAGKPAMLFPSPAAALERLCEALKVDSSTSDFCRSDVLAQFPADRGSDHWRDSIWRGDNPRRHRRIRLSHAAWWLASNGGTKLFALDDRYAWTQAFDVLLPPIVEGRVPVFQIGVFKIGERPATALDGSIFDEVPIELPSRASETLAGSLYRPGYHTFLACDLLDPRGDRYFERGQTEPVWRNLQIPTGPLQALIGGSLESAKSRPFNFSTATDFVRQQLATMERPTLTAVRAAARGRGNRSLIDAEYRAQMAEKTGERVRPGRRPKNQPAKSAKK